MTLTIIFNTILMVLVFAGIVGLLSAGIVSNRRWATSLSSPVRRRERIRVSPRETAARREAVGRRQPRRQYLPAR